MSKYFNKTLFGARLLQLMSDNNDTTYSLGEHLHLSNATISRYTTGGISPKIPTVQAIAEKYGVNPAWLMGTVGAEKYTDREQTGKKIPIIGTIAAGSPILAQENIEGYEFVPENLQADFCLRVKGDSMIGARILDGDLVYIRQQPEVENGEIAAVMVGDEEATLKRFYKFNGTVLLRPENPNYQAREFSRNEMKQIRILGKAVFFRSEVR